MVSKNRLGENLKKARQKAGLSQVQLAKKAKIHANYYARVERGEVNPSVEIVENIAKALNVKSSEILPF